MVNKGLTHLNLGISTNNNLPESFFSDSFRNFIDNCSIQPLDMEKISNIFRMNESITSLELSRNQIDDNNESGIEQESN